MNQYKKRVFAFVCAMSLLSCSSNQPIAKVTLTLGIDASSGGDPSYIVSTANATYYLDKQGGGLSSLVDSDGIDWIGFNKQKGTGWKGEYRGFPNAVHKQDGSYFHAMNSSTLPSTSEIEIQTRNHVRIRFVSDNKHWQGVWDFYPDRLDFTMAKVSEGYHYWIQYEGAPGGTMDETDYWYNSASNEKHQINTGFNGDLPALEWVAFGDATLPRMLYLVHHENDQHPDNYESRPHMTVFAFGRKQKNKYLNTPQRFSIGFIESTNYDVIVNNLTSNLVGN